MTGKLTMSFSDKLTSEQRELAEASVRAMIEKTGAGTAEDHARRARDEELQRAAMAPLNALVQNDAKASAALKAMAENAKGMNGLGDLNIADLSHLRDSRRVPQVTPYVLAIPEEPPFDYSWSYNAPGSGAPHQNVVDAPSGNLILNAMSGSIAGGVRASVDTHCGFGLVFTLGHRMSVRVYASLDFRYQYLVHTRGVGTAAVATVDGGADAAIFSNGAISSLLTTPFYHKRISGIDDAQTSMPFAAYNYPGGMGGQTPAGQCAFNLGIWAKSSYHDGTFASAASQSSCQAVVHNMLVAAT